MKTETKLGIPKRVGRIEVLDFPNSEIPHYQVLESIPGLVKKGTYVGTINNKHI